MKRFFIGVCVALLMAGCGATGGKKATVEQKDVFDQKGAPATAAAAAEEAKARADNEARAKAEAERRAREAAAKAAEQPVVRPLPEARVGGGAITDPVSALKDPASPLSKRSVYYDFDMYSIREEFQPIVEAHAKLLRDHKDLRVRIEGNCDERGSREYNLALGQRRADAVKRALTLLGVPAQQIETVSFGAEKPKATGSNEEAWAENRRSDIVYVGIDAQ
ncbi:MAG TPA: peptidoglycan-associated lipoprotein Pal [Burkholderiales bacterium]|nr:peptidoglycan-associated lipoprotein Pal [Burkholderiales bacterium]